MDFIMHQSDAKTQYFLDSLITHKSFKLLDNISNQLIHQYYIILLLIMLEMRHTRVDLS